MLEAVLFDLDETLVDRQAAIRAFLPDQYMRFAERLPGLSAARYTAAFLALEEGGMVDKSRLYPRLADELGLMAGSAELLLADFRATYPGFAALSAGALETLAALRRRGLGLGIVSNGQTVVQSAKIAATGLLAAVDKVVISESVGLRKPDRLIFELAARRLDTEPGRCLFVGDNPEADVKGAEDAGMCGVFYGEAASWPEALPPPWHRVGALVDLLAIVDMPV
jgi:putative hydrolase of the HAD superfamily